MKKTQYLVLCPMNLSRPVPFFEKPNGSIFIAYNNYEEAVKQSEGGKWQVVKIEIS